MLRKVMVIGVVGLCAGLMLATSSLASAQEKVRIRYWTFLDSAGTGGRSVGQRMTVEAFEAMHPNIDVVEEVVVWSKIPAKLITSTAAGKGPDVSRVAAENLGLHAGAGVAAPMDPFVADWTPEQKDDWLIPWNVTVYDGHKLFLQIETRVWPLWYRKDLLDAAGVAIPKNCTQLAKAAGKIQTDRIMGLAIHISPVDQAYGLGAWMYSTLWSAGLDILNENGTAAFNKEPGVRLLQWIYDLIYKYKGSKKEILAMDGEAVLTAYRAGNVCFFLEGTHRVKTARESLAVGDKLQLIPPVTFEDYGYPAKAQVEGWHLIIGVNSKYKKEAFQFIEHVVSPEMQLINVQVGGELPSRKSTYQSPWFTVPWVSADAQEKIQWSRWINEFGHLGIFHEEYLAWREELMHACHDVILERRSPKEAVDHYAEAYNKRVGLQ